MTHSNARSIEAFIGEIERRCTAHGQPFGLRELLFCIRDIPYGRPALPREPASVLADWKGTCSGKHLLASAVLEAIGLRTRLYCLPYPIDSARNLLPHEVLETFMGLQIWDVHNFIELEMPSGRVKVDVTWTRDLFGYGFPTTLDWDGSEHFCIAAPITEQAIETNAKDLDASKTRLLGCLNSRSALSLRDQYIAGLAAFATRHSCGVHWLESIGATLADIRRCDKSRK